MSEKVIVIKVFIMRVMYFRQIFLTKLALYSVIHIPAVTKSFTLSRKERITRRK